MILPAFGIVSEIVPVFARKPIFGYKAIAFSTIGDRASPRCSSGAHHMFTVGLPIWLNIGFMLDRRWRSPSRPAIKVFNWLATLWRGQHLVRHADAVRARLHRPLHDRRAHRDLPRDLPDRLAGARLATSSSRTCTTCCFGGVAVRDLRRALLLVAEALRPDARRAARQGDVLAHLRRLQPDLLPAAPARADGDAAARLHLRPRRASRGLQPALDDRLVRDGRRAARLPRQRDQERRAPAGAPATTRGRPTRSSGTRPRRRPHGTSTAAHDHERATAARPAAAAEEPGASDGDDAAPGPWLRLLAVAAAFATGLAVVSGAGRLGHGARAARRAGAAAARAALVALARIPARRSAAGRASRRSSSSAVGGASSDARRGGAPRGRRARARRPRSLLGRRRPRRRRGAAGAVARLRDADEAARSCRCCCSPGGAAAFVGACGRARGWDVFAVTMVGLALACGGAAALNHVPRPRHRQAHGRAHREAPGRLGPRSRPRGRSSSGSRSRRSRSCCSTRSVNLLDRGARARRQPLLRLRLHALAEAHDAAEHRDRRRRRRRAAARRLRGRDRARWAGRRSCCS